MAAKTIVVVVVGKQTTTAIVIISQTWELPSAGEQILH